MVRIYVLRRDGVIQRYHVKGYRGWVKIGTYKNRGLWAKPDIARSYAAMRVREYEKLLRELPPEVELPRPREIEKRLTLYRYSYGVKYISKHDRVLHIIPVHSVYYGALIQGYSSDPLKLEGLRYELRGRLIESLEDFLGYPEEEWWFFIDDGEGFQEMDYDIDLDGTFYVRIEDDEGNAVWEDWGELDEL